MGLSHWSQGMHENAVTELRKAVALGGGPVQLADLGCLLGCLDQKAEAQEILADLGELGQPDECLPYLSRFRSRRFRQSRRSLRLVQARLGTRKRPCRLSPRVLHLRRFGLFTCRSALLRLTQRDRSRSMSSWLQRFGLPRPSLRYGQLTLHPFWDPGLRNSLRVRRNHSR